MRPPAAARASTAERSGIAPGYDSAREELGTGRWRPDPTRGPGGELDEPRLLARPEGEVQRSEVSGERGGVEGLPTRRAGSHGADVGERLVPGPEEGLVHVLDRAGMGEGEIPADRPDPVSY